ncbi:MAG TPA: hypothetical protein VJT14_08795 [Candidatus Dormibacteraeota bacterium]|nr:hypothetical protein [Candidatus Dormibacteraeota bacterium]
MDVVNEARGAMRVSEVFGAPYEKDGIAIIPAARISGGARAIVKATAKPR